MRSINTVIVLCIVPAVLASSPFSSSVRSSTISQLECATLKGTKSVKPVPSATLTLSFHLPPIIGTSVSTPTATITPAPTVTTSTVFTTTTITTTDTTVTDTFSTTSTITTTDTYTVSDTTSSTSTTTIVSTASTTTTTVVPTSPGFLPIESTTATAYPGTSDKKRNAHPRERRVADPKPAPDVAAISYKKRKSSPPTYYPKEVVCLDTVEVKTTIIYIHTTTATTTTLPTGTITATSTSTVTTTSTVVPADVSTTLSFSTTTTIDTTITSTTTVSVTDTTSTTLTVTSTSSVYAACASNNLLAQLPNGQYPIGISDSNNFNQFPSDSAYDCCVSCITSGNCGVALYNGPDSVQPNLCQISVSSTCTNQASFARAYFYSDEEPGFYTTDINGYCGYFYDGGAF